jgi:hypothetical protein
MIASDSQPSRPFQATLVAICLIALLLMLHNFVVPLLPDSHWMLPTGEIQPETPGATTHAFAVPFALSGGDSFYDARSRVTLFEDGRPLANHMPLALIRSMGKGLFAHQGGRLIFSSTDNSDPRTNSAMPRHSYFLRRSGFSIFGRGVKTGGASAPALRRLFPVDWAHLDGT